MSIYSSSSVPTPRANSNFAGFDAAAPSIHAIANARIYHTQLEAKKDEWTYSRLKGTLKFGRNWGPKLGEPATTSTAPSSADEYWFTLSDEHTGRTIWMFQIPSAFFYEVDRPFFHVFNGRTRKYGFLFEDDDDAALFSKKVINESCKGVVAKRGRSMRSKSKPSQHFRSKSLSTSISRSMISSPAPNSFRHISHVGVSGGGVFEVSKDVDDNFKENLIKLQGGAGTTSVIIHEHTDFVDSFWKDVERGVATHIAVPVNVAIAC